MATPSSSRFAVLTIDVDEPKSKKPLKPSTVPKATGKIKNDNKQNQQPQKKNDKKKSKQKKKNTGAAAQQWEQWKQKDEMTVEEKYKQELHEALLLSKIDHEIPVDTEVKETDPLKKTAGKKAKTATMSLEEFNNLGSTENTETSSLPQSQSNNKTLKSKESDNDFFERMDKEAQQEMIKNKEKDSLKTRLNTLDDDITSAQLKVEVEKRNEVILRLKKEIDILKQELSEVKERNKKLYKILAHGEMKDKASVLAEVAKLQDIRDELTSEVTSLHAQLEQERSKSLKPAHADSKPSKHSNKKKPANEKTTE